MSVALGIVLALASALSAGLLALGLFNTLTMRRLADEPAGLERWPRLSVVVPARDEAATIGPALRSKLADDYPDLEIVVVDDRSTDGTGAIVRRLEMEDDRLRVVRINELRPGWLGKVHALHRGTGMASGEFVLFSDADAHLAPGTLRRTVALCQREELDLLALVPRWEPGTAAVDAVIAWFMAFLSVGELHWLAERPGSPFAMGSGSFTLVRREVFERSEGFEWLRMETGDDVALGMMMKRAGARCALLDGRGAVSVALYETVPAMVTGIEKNIVTFGGGKLPVVLCSAALLAFLDLSPFGLLALGGGWAWWGAVVVAFHTAAQLTLTWRNGRKVLTGLAWPLASLAFAAMCVRGGLKASRAGGVEWRGTFYDFAELRAGRRLRVG